MLFRSADLKKTNPKFQIDLIQIFSENDPTVTNKYLPFMVKQAETWVDWLKDELKNNTFKEMFDIVREFEDLSQRELLENKDIYSYKNNQEIVNVIKTAREKITKSQVKKNETITIHEDDRWLVLQPLTTRSSNIYGKSTKWCVSSDQNDYKKYFNQYTENGVLIFVIDKQVEEDKVKENIFAKVAFHNDKNKTDSSAITVWDTKDVQINASGMLELMSVIPSDIMKIVNTTIKGKTNRELAEEKKLVEKIKKSNDDEQQELPF